MRSVRNVKFGGAVRSDPDDMLVLTWHDFFRGLRGRTAGQSLHGIAEDRSPSCSVHVLAPPPKAVLQQTSRFRCGPRAIAVVTVPLPQPLQPDRRGAQSHARKSMIIARHRERAG